MKNARESAISDTKRQKCEEKKNRLFGPCESLATSMHDKGFLSNTTEAPESSLRISTNMTKNHNRKRSLPTKDMSL